MKYTSFAWWIAKYCDFFYFFLFVISVCLHPHTGGELLRMVKTFYRLTIYFSMQHYCTASRLNLAYLGYKILTSGYNLCNTVDFY